NKNRITLSRIPKKHHKRRTGRDDAPVTMVTMTPERRRNAVTTTPQTYLFTKRKYPTKYNATNKTSPNI
ncbi:21046_t:CDS:2, partial [Dentiscutata erythropus]